ncbi:hypothetical protein ACUM5Y_01645 [Marinomonas dokdonensis]|uniref:hypothetical protein n=1 Tax=Marinomonas dokdonensis TaxID=328224 RepID=UPI00405584AF
MEKKIDLLRKRVREVGEEMERYYHFFPKLAEKIVLEFGEYIGDPESVNFINLDGDVSPKSKHRSGVCELRRGRYLIPILVTIHNIEDNGCMYAKVILSAYLKGDEIYFDGNITATVKDDDLTPLYDCIFNAIYEDYSLEVIFSHGENYQSSKIGFTKG